MGNQTGCVIVALDVVMNTLIGEHAFSIRSGDHPQWAVFAG